MQSDRLQHSVVKQSAQERQSDILVSIINATQRRRFALVVDHVAEVVQQRGDDQCSIGAAFSRQLCRLQCMLQLSDRLACIHAVALGCEQRLDVVEAKGHYSTSRVPAPRVLNNWLLLAHHARLRQVRQPIPESGRTLSRSMN